VLVHLPEHPLDLAVLLAATDSKELKGRSIPPGTAWYYAQLPRRTVSASPIIHRMKYPDHLHCIQFAVGGCVYPPLRRWVKVTSRFRGRVIRCLGQIIAPASQGRYDLLTPAQKDDLSLICGKDGQLQLLRGHRHAFFLLWPDENGFPTRLIAWRSSPFTTDEVKALLAASEYPVSWDDSTPDWNVRLIPLPYETPAPIGLFGEARVWSSVTPFVPPSDRHRFRKNGREVIVTKEGQNAQWVNLHETRERRMLKADNRTPWVRPGFSVCVEFPSLVAGPLLIGDSCHFGLGLFVANWQEG
jgi:CRISPR-associated protein Csb2